MSNLFGFYQSKEWKKLRKLITLERINENGDLICEHCHKPIVKAYDAICHHKIELNDLNVNDPSISLNPDNIMVVHHACHNEIHKRFGSYTRHIYIVYGSPCSGKAEFVKRNALKEDLIIDIDKIYQAISINPPYIKPDRLFSNARQVRDVLVDMVKVKNGKWVNAWLVGNEFIGKSMWSKRDREDLSALLGAELIYIDTPMEECLANANERNNKDYEKYIKTWFERYQA